MSFPATRMRRLRRTPGLRRLVCETPLRPRHFVLPLFVRPGKNEKRPITSMPGHAQLSVDLIVQEAREAARLGLGGGILFGIPSLKDARGPGAYAADGIVQKAVAAIKDATPDLVVIGDVCLCEYTDHGHCGVVRTSYALPGHVRGLVARRGGVHAARSFVVDNDSTLPLLAKSAVSLAKAGADIVAPSAMMDGQVGAIREELDAAGLEETVILGYAAKFASAFYGPFRDAAESPPKFGDRRGYQMDPSNAREALREIALDIEEGADMVMVKPALPYLDILRRARARWDLPLAAYQVSGEYAMLKAAAARGWLDEKTAAMETLDGIKRAGADFILTYYAKDAARWLGA